MLKNWLDVYIKPCRAQKTIICYSTTIKLIKIHAPDFKKTPISDVQELDIQRLINSLSGSYSKSTLRKIRTVLHEAYNASIRNNECTVNPANSITIPRNASEKKVRALTQEEQKQVEIAAETDKLGAIVIFFLYTGLRAAELCNLKWCDYDERENIIYIRESKTPAGRRKIPLLPKAKKMIEIQPKISNYIFTSTTGKPVTQTVLQKLSYRMRRATGINWITTHVYRHSFATRLVEQGVDYRALATLLGHTDVAFTLQRYTNADDDFLKEQIFLLDSKHKQPE